MKFAVLLLNQILSPGTALQLRKPICNSTDLQVHNKASNIACRAELGKFPKISDINKKILNYLSYLIGKDEDSVVKQALQIQLTFIIEDKIAFTLIS